MYKIIGADLKEYGPITSDQIRQWIAEGRLNAQSKIQAEGSSEWKFLRELPEFGMTAPAAAPAPPQVMAMPAPAPRKTNGMAVASLVLGCLALPPCCSVILGPVGIILGAIGLSQLKKRPDQQGRGMAIAGIILSILGLLFYGMFVAWYLLSGGQQQLQQMLQNH